MEPFSLRPKLVVPDAAAALAFYESALGAETVSRYEHDGRVVFAELAVLGGTVTLKDEDAADPAPATTGAPGPILDVMVADPDEVARRLVQAGAEVVYPVADQPYGARGGRVRDPFGVQWLVQTPTTMGPNDWDELQAGSAG